MTTTHVPQHDRSTAVLNKARRQAGLSRLCEETVKGDTPDPLVASAGITGIGITLDTASRSLKTVLVKSEDLAFGISCWSSKLTHSGLRCLAGGNAGVACRSTIERDALLDVTALHLIHNLPQVVSVMDKLAPLTRVLPRLGFLAGGLLHIIADISTTTLPLSWTVSSRRVSQLSPTARRRDVKFGYVSYDGQLHDDTYLVTAIARTIANYGITILIRVRCENASGTSTALIDELIGESFELPTHAVVNVIGVWVVELAMNIKIHPSRGTHLILDVAKLDNPAGSLTVPIPDHTNYFCFTLLTEHNHVYIGLTDEDAPGPVPGAPKVPEDDIVFLFGVINQALKVPLTHDNVIGALADPCPLIGTDEAHTADLSHEHALLEVPNGLISVTGGKLTKYRLMAGQAVDKVAEKLGASLAPRSTHTILVLGPEPEVSDRVRTAAAADRIPMPLSNHYGVESFEIVGSCLLDQPLDPVAEELDVIRAEFTRHVTHEGVLSVGGIPDRHIRLGLVVTSREAALSAVEEALGLA